jgi:putative ABC transport system substrate-binding protein
VIVVPSSSIALVVKQATTAIPIVVAAMADPERLKLIESDARPGGNVTGILVNLDGLPGKQLEIAVEVMSGASKIGFLFNAANPGIAFLRPELEAAAARLNVKLVRADIRSPDDLDAAFHALAAEHVDIVMVGQDAMLRSEAKLIASLAAAVCLPFMDGQREFAEAGGIISYGISLRENYQRAAYYVDRILKGAKPGELPAELPTKVEMVINRKAARALGITIPPSLLLRADEVIE